MSRNGPRLGKTMRAAATPRRRAASRPRRRHAASAAGDTRSLAWLLSGDGSGVFGRSLTVALTGAVLWTFGMLVVETRLASPDAASGPMVERLLFSVEENGARRFASRLFAGRLPANFVLPDDVRAAIVDASETVGVDRGYLVAVAALESGFDPGARAQGTSAAGLYQFTDDTWLRVVKVFGARHGLADYAGEINVGERGDVSMPRGVARTELMQRRHDPRIAALMAAELALDNKHRLERVLGRPVTPAEIYIGHFLGVSQAARIIDAAYSRPLVPAARLVPAAAATNPGVFNPAGEAVSAGAVVGAVEDYFSREVTGLNGI